MNLDTLLAHGLLPDALVRIGIRRLLRRRLREEDRTTEEAQRAHLEAYVAGLRKAPIAVHAQDANAQHYEVPAAFYRLALGRRLKYSCALWPPRVHGLDAAEEALLRLTCDRAELADGQDVLELGCGWGSLTLWMAESTRGRGASATSWSSPRT